jgi:hypothetical protein
MSDDIERPTKDATEYAGMVQLLREIAEQEKALAERKKVIKQTLAEFLGDAEIGTVNGAPAFRYLKSYPRRLDQQALKEARPEVFAAFVNEREARTFTLVEED